MFHRIIGITYNRYLQLSIYSPPESIIVLQEAPSELERQIGTARSAVTATLDDAHARVQEVVSKWIGVEHAVEGMSICICLCFQGAPVSHTLFRSVLEARVKSLLAPDEPLTPGLLYVGVAGLAGSVFARNRLFLRFLLPPTLVILSAKHFLPHTTSNVSAYFGSLEETYVPGLARKHAVAQAHTAMTIDLAKEATRNGREKMGESVMSALGWLEGSTGLKLRETLGWGQEVAGQVERQVKSAAKGVEEKVEFMRKDAEEKVETLKEDVGRKAK